MRIESDYLDIVAQTIFDKKGFNILVLDLTGISSMTDYFIIAEGTVDRHVQSLARAITDQLSELGKKPLHIEGEGEGNWVVIDYGDMVIHLFTPEYREKYAIEALWKEGNIVDVKIEISQSKKLKENYE